MSGYRKSLDRPDEQMTLGGLTQDVVEIGDFTVGRIVHPPGWRWSKDLKPIVGGDWCMARHVGLVVSGRQGVELKDGTTFEVGAFDVYDIPPAHDLYVIGDEPVVAVDWSGVEAWTGFRVRLGERVLAGLLMTDIVGSTTAAVRIGDAAWKRRLAEHYETVRSQLDRYRGREIDTTGDAMFVLFDGAARALECAAAIRDASERDGIRVRSGVHVGEVELHGRRARGIAVHEVARIIAYAKPGEILASEATRTLVFGARMTFEDRGSRELKGFEKPRRLYAYTGVA